MARAQLTLVPPRPNSGPGPSAVLPRRRLGEILQARGLISAAQIDHSLERQSRMEVRLGDLLRFDAALGEADLLRALEDQWQTGPLDLAAAAPDPALIRDVGVEHCLQTRTLPWRRIGGATVIATAQPDRFADFKPDLEAQFGPVMLAVVSERDLIACLTRLFPEHLSARAELGLPAGQSCRNWRGDLFVLGSLTLLGVVASATLMSPGVMVGALSALALLVLLAIGLLKVMALHATLRQRREPPSANVHPLHPAATQRLPVVSILVPLYHEENIAGHLVARLQRLKYPEALLDVCLIIEADDDITRRTLAATGLPDWIRVIPTPPGTLKTKPRALNYALHFCRGSIVGVYDAEDAPDPDQIAHVVTHFARCPREVACLQGRLSFYNSRQNWFSRCFAIEYATWFGVILPGISRLGLAVPLGGTTIFFQTAVLKELGGWDAYNVTEDADLGIRLARRGYRTELIDSTTEEEANCAGWAWVKQRSRWLKGYAMTYATHMQDPVQLWRDLGPRGFCGFQVMFLGTLLQSLLAPVLWSWWIMLAGLPHPAQSALGHGLLAASFTLLLASEALTFALSVTALGKTRQMRLLPWVLSLNIYYMMTTLAAYKALIELMYRPFFWDKTRHGLSLTPALQT